MAEFKEKDLRFAFIISVALKGIFSALEILASFLFFFTGTLTSIITSAANAELVEDPTDFIATHVRHVLPYFSAHMQLFTAFYLLSHGIIKLFLVISLLRKKLWAYPAMIIVLFIFIAYQVFQLSYGFSYFMLLLTVFDALIIMLTWHEYEIVKKISPTKLTEIRD